MWMIYFQWDKLDRSNVKEITGGGNTEKSGEAMWYLP